MEKGNKNRIIIWGVIWLICAIFGIGGLISYYNGYGRIGQARKKLTPVCEEFLKVDSVIRYRDISAEVSGDKIVVSYTKNSPTKKFEYVYSVENGRSIITNTYKKADANIAEVIAKGMIDAVYHLNNGTGTGSVFEEYQYGVFSNTTVDNGANLSMGDTNQIKINLDQNIVKNIKALQGNIEDSQITYINTNDILDLKDNLKETGDIELKKGTINIYIKENESNYEIYASDNDMTSEDLKNSIANVVLALNSEAWNEAINKDEKFTTASASSLYKVETDYVITDEVSTHFSDYAKIVRITVNK